MRIFSALFLALTLASAAHADDWPQWMGPKRDNVWREKGILDKFPEGGPKVLWRAKVANGYSGPAVADGLVVLTDFIPSESVLDKDNFDRDKFKGKERVLCFDAKTGDLKWKHEYPCTNNVSYPNGPRCTPVFDAGKVYTLGAVGDLLCFEAKTGKVIWSRDFKKDYDAEIPLWGFAAHPLIDGNRLICMVGGKGSVAVAFDKNDGKEIWKALTAAEPGYSPPSIIEAGGTRQLVIWHPESLNSLNPETGKVYWSVKQPTANGTSIMTPRKLDDFLFIGAWQHKARLLKLDSDKPGVHEVWKGNRDNAVYPVNNTPFLEAGHIYGVCNDGELRCVDIKTGDRLWETYAPTSGEKLAAGTAHLIKHEDRFFIAAETGHLIIAKLSPKGYTEISRWQMLEPTSRAYGRNVLWSHPAFAQQCVFARNDKELICVSLAAAPTKDDYKLGPDSMEQPDVPKGEIIPFKWESKVFAGTVRDCWIYVPKQYDGKEPACVMVFQDGGGYQNRQGQYRAPTVMDNLIHKKEIPVMIGIFINPGSFPDKDKKKGGSNRSFEYDTLSPQYVEFLEKEILPEVGKKYKLRSDAAARGICGASSGGICAFTAAWERPDLFSKVLSHIGSFANIRGGDRYPGIVRAAKKRDIRVFLQDGSNDLNNTAGNWYLCNLQMESALKFKGYDVKTAWGDGGHTGKHGGAILPESMRWLWRDTPAAKAP